MKSNPTPAPRSRFGSWLLIRIFPEGQVPLPAAAVTIPEVLHGAGYVSGAIGKWGLGFVGTEGDPLAQGFDRFFGYNCQRFTHRYYPSYLWEGER